MRGVPLGSLVAAAAVACTHGGIDRRVGYGFRTTVDVGDVPVRGFPVKVETATGGTVSGELLAADGAYIYVLTDAGGTEEKTLAIPANGAVRASVELYPSYWGAALGWTLLGTASTLSHGLFLIFTAPTWLLVGGITTGLTAGSNHLDVESAKLPKLWQFARFPAGLPPGWPDEPNPPPAPVSLPLVADAGLAGPADAALADAPGTDQELPPR